jgi:hypothetical protein
MVWNTSSLIWEAATPGGGGAGGPATIIDGGDVAQGSKSDVAWVSGDGTVISLLKKIANPAGGGLTDVQLRASAVPVDDLLGSTYLGAILTVDGDIKTEAQATNATLTTINGKLPNLSAGIAIPVDGSSFTQPTNLLFVSSSNVGLANTGVVGAGTQRVTLATNVALPAGTNLMGKVGIDQTTPGTTNRVDIGNIPHVIHDTGSTTVVTGNVAVTSAGLTNLDVALSTRLKPADTLAAVTNLAQMGGVAISLNTGVRDAGTQRVSVATNDVVHVDDNGGSLTVDGTVTTTPPADATTNVTKIAGTAADVNSGVKSAGTLRVVLATDQPALTNKLLVTPDSVALPANQSVNMAQIAATATAVNSGNKDAGTLRVVLATDQPALTNKLLVTPDSVALPANQSVNVAQMGGVATAMNTGTRSTGTLRVTVATDDLVPVSLPTLTKGTQGSTGTSCQDLKDAGRNLSTLFHAAPIITTTAEVMQSLTGYKSGAAVGATTTPAVVTSGKTYRIQSVEIHYTAATVIGGALVRLRALSSGVALIGSPLVKTWQVGVPAIFTAGAMMTYIFDYPDGLEFAGGFGLAIGVQGVGADGTTGTITGKVMVVINGYEY